MADYDSILKEKKTYDEPKVIDKEKKQKKFPWLLIDLVCLIMILIVSYIVYYNTVLAPKQIFLNDIKTVANKYQGILEYLNLDKLYDLSYNLNGTIDLNDKIYNFTLNKSNQEVNLNLNLNEESLHYYVLSNQKFIKLSSFNPEYYYLPNKSNNSYLNVISNLKSYLSNNLTEAKFIKKFYLNGTSPIVESNLVLKDEDIKLALGLDNLANSYEVLFTFKNNAITNEIISMKITINNLTTNGRGVFLYEDGDLTYKDDKQSLKFKLEEKNKDFILKIYQDDILFSVLSGSNQISGYQYIYQIIDKIYNIVLNVNEKEGIYNYQLSSMIESNGDIDEQKVNLTLKSSSDFIVNNTDISSAIGYDTLTDEEKAIYQTSLDNIMGDLRQFIKKHQ